MRDRLLLKCSVFGIVLLFIGVMFAPISGNNLVETTSVLRGELNSISAEKSVVKQKLDENLFFDRAVTLLMRFGHIPSLSACIIKGNEVVWAEGYGLYDIEHTKAASEDTIYAVASISKVVTATALMQLHDQGLFDLDDDISDYLNFSIRNPNYPDDPITFQMLLAHRSSLAEEPWYLHELYPGDCPVPLYPFLKEYVTPGGNEYSSEVWVDCRPGEEFHYANIGYWIIGFMVEIISGKPFDQYCKDYIFEPLNMPNTSFRFADIDKEKLAVPYIYGFWEYEPFMHYGSVGYPSDGLRTSVVDLSHFLIAHMNGGVYNGVRILEEDTVELMQTPQYSDDYYGLGWQIWKNLKGETFIGYGGGNIGVSSNMAVRTSDDVAVMFFVNRKITLYRELGAELVIERLLFLKSLRF